MNIITTISITYTAVIYGEEDMTRIELLTMINLQSRYATGEILTQKGHIHTNTFMHICL